MASSPPTSHPRHWWLKRFTLAGTLALCLLAIIWCLWSWYANRALDREIAKLRAAGRPTAREDLRRAVLDDDHNAIPLLRAALGQMPTVDVPASSSMTFKEELPYPRAWHVMMDKAYPAYAGIYPQVRRAREIGRTDWGAFSAGPLMSAGPAFAPLRQLAIVLGDTALYHHFRGNDAAALETANDLLFLSDATADYPFLISKLVGCGIRALAVDRIQVIATGTRIAAADSATSPTGAGTTPASRDQVRALISALLNDRIVPEQFSRSVYEEGVMAIDGLDASGLYILRPLNVLGIAAVLSREEDVVRAMSQPNLPAAGRSSSRADPWVIGATTQFRISAKLARHPFQLSTQQLGAAISLAVSLYRADHGRIPATLGELVPAYLPRVPLDPLSANGAPFSYMIVANGKRPILISAGMDGITQTTDESFIPTRAMYGWQDTRGNRCDDQYQDLTAWKDPSPPPEDPDSSDLTRDAQNDQGQQPNAPGQDKQPHQPGQQPQTGNGKGDQH